MIIIFFSLLFNCVSFKKLNSIQSSDNRLEKFQNCFDKSDETMKASLGCSFVWLNFSFHSSCFWWWYIYFIFIRVKLFDDFKFANIKYFDEYLTDILSTNLMVVTRSLCVVISDDKIVKAKYKYENTPNSSKIDENIFSKYTLHLHQLMEELSMMDDMMMNY